MASSLIATQTTLTLRRPTAAAFFHSAQIHRLPHGLSLSPLLRNSKSTISPSISPNLKISAINSIKPLKSDRDFLSGSTRTATTLLAIALTASKFAAHDIFSLAARLREPVLSAAGAAFFAAIREAPTASMNTPLTVVAAGMAKWLDIYSGVLMVRVLLSWFPNIPWDRQPLSAIRDLCDPYLNLFRNIIPPIFNTLDVSPLFAFTALGALGSILKTGR